VVSQNQNIHICNRNGMIVSEFAPSEEELHAFNQCFFHRGQGRRSTPNTVHVREFLRVLACMCECVCVNAGVIRIFLN